MWIPTYDTDGKRTGKANTQQITCVQVAEYNADSSDESESWFEVYGLLTTQPMMRVRVTPHRYLTRHDAIDHIDELDWNEPPRCK